MTSKKEVKRAALLYRVSTEQQAEKYSLPAQQRILTKYAQDQGWEIREYNEGAVSGTRLRNRPVMIQLLNDIEAGFIDLVLVIEFERLTRDTEGFDRAEIFKALKDHNIKIATPTQMYDPRDVHQKFQLDLNAILSAYEIGKLRDRCRRGIVQAKLSGRWLGGIPPTGYKYANGRLEKDGFFAGIINKIFQMAKTHSINKILTWAQANNIPTLRNGKWDNTRIRRILHNCFYAGFIRVQGKLIKGLHPPIISRELFDSVQLDIRGRVYHDFNTAPGSILTGLIFCGSCMNRMNTCACRKKRKSGKQYEKKYYRCRGRNAGVCKRKLIQQERLDGIVLARIQKVVENLRVIEDVYKKAMEDDPDRTRLDELAREHHQLREKKGNLLKAVENGIFDMVEISRRANQLHMEMRAVEKEMDDLNRKGPDQVTFEEISSVIRNFTMNFSRLDFQSRRELLSNILDKVVVYDNNLYLFFKFPVHAGGNKVRVEL